MYSLVTKLEELNGQSFDSKAVIKPWLHSKLVPLGIHVVIARSDDTKIVFKCRSQLKPGCVHSRATGRVAKEGCGEKKTCPFRIRANYSVRAQKWSLVVINGSHNHKLVSPSVAQPMETLPKPTLTLRQASVLDSNLLPPLVSIAMSPSTSCGSNDGDDFGNYNHSCVRISNEQHPIARTKYTDVLKLLATLNASACVSDDTREAVYEGMLKALRDVVPKGDSTPHQHHYQQHAPIVLPGINHLTPPSDNTLQFYHPNIAPFYL